MKIVTFKEIPGTEGKTRIEKDLEECPDCGAIALEHKTSHDARQADKDVCHDCGYENRKMPTG